MKANYLIFPILLVINIIFFVSCKDEEILEENQVFDDELYESPKPLNIKSVYIAEHFDDYSKSDSRWIRSEAKENDKIYNGEWKIEPPLRWGLHGDKGLVLKSEARHAAIATLLDKQYEFSTKPFIIQYEVTFQEHHSCGGAYLKLLSKTASDLKKFHDKTVYSIMFGPDFCGTDNKLHFIFNHYNPVNGSYEEKHCKQGKERFDEIYTDGKPHLFTLILNPDNNFEIEVDGRVINNGNLFEDFQPAVNPPAEIDDPNDFKPDNWDDKEKIPDPEAKKPDDWNEDEPAQIPDPQAIMPDGWLENVPEHVPDPDAKRPEDWDSEMDGEWEPALIDNPLCQEAPGCGPWEPPIINNPAYKGKWRPPLIDNPNYQGKWRPRKIPNPDYFEDKEPFKMQPIVAVGFELWTMTRDIYFDNIIITDNISVARHWADSTFEKKKQRIIQNSASLIQRIAIWTNKYPILWVLYIVLLGFPVAFILYLCCRTSSPTASQQKKEKEEGSQSEGVPAASTGDKKKTDEPTEDVLEEEEDKVLENAIPEREEIDPEKESGPDSSEDEDDDVSNKSEDSVEVDALRKGAGDAGEGTRKRKVRKD